MSLNETCVSGNKADVIIRLTGIILRNIVRHLGNNQLPVTINIVDLTVAVAPKEIHRSRVVASSRVDLMDQLGNLC